MGQPLTETEIKSLLAELQSDRAKRRWSIVQKLSKLDVDNEQIVIALETMAVQDPVEYVRKEAQAVLRAPMYQAILQRHKEAGVKTSTATTCPRCSYENSSGIKFCQNCGTMLAMNCHRCGTLNPLNISLCGNCGVNFSEAHWHSHRRNRAVV